MTRPVINDILTTETFGIWVDKTNQLIELMQDSVLLASNDVSYVTIGNSTLNGSLTANTIIATTARFSDISSIGDLSLPIDIISPLEVTSDQPVIANFISTIGTPTIQLTNPSTLSWEVKHQTASANTSLIIKTEASGTPQFLFSQTGALTANTFVGSFSGDGSNITNINPSNITGGDFSVDDKIIHTGDINTSIRFPINDTVAIETNGIERFRITSSGNVGIGTNSPTNKLHVSLGDVLIDSTSENNIILSTTVANVNPSNFVFRKSRGGATPSIITANDILGRIQFEGYNGSTYVNAANILARAGTNTGSLNSQLWYTALQHMFVSGSTEVMRINNAGNIGVGTTTPSSKLHVVGDISATNFNSLSDVLYKENVSSIENSFDILEKINPVNFSWKQTGIKSYGVIAQELEKILPELVNTDSNGIKSVQYTPLIALLIDAIQKQKAEIIEIKDQLLNLS